MLHLENLAVYRVFGAVQVRLGNNGRFPVPHANARASPTAPEVTDGKILKKVASESLLFVPRFKDRPGSAGACPHTQNLASAKTETR